MKFLGCGSAFCPEYGNTAAYLSVEENLILIDCGEQVFGKLYEKHLLETHEKIYVFITHLHADHVGSLGSLISYAYYVLNKKITVIYPDKALGDFLDLNGIDRAAYYLENRHGKIGGVELKAIPVKHAEDMNCYGYLIKEEKRYSFYSGDSYEIPETVYNEFQQGKIDRLYQDTTEFQSAHRSHLPLQELIEAVPEEKRENVFCMHFGSDFFEKIQRAGFGNVRDLMESE